MQVKGIAQMLKDIFENTDFLNAKWIQSCFSFFQLLYSSLTSVKYSESKLK